LVVAFKETVIASVIIRPAATISDVNGIDSRMFTSKEAQNYPFKHYIFVCTEINIEFVERSGDKVCLFHRI
jgi:hypothetical protein